MSIQVYDNSQVQQAPLPGARQESVASPGLMGGAADSQIALGSGALAAGTGLEAVAYHMQQKENLAKVQAATADYGNAVLNWKLDAEKNRTGAAAEGATGDFSDFHKKTTEEISKTLGNPAQREAFVLMAQKNGLSARHEVGTFEIMQMRKANADAYQSLSQTLTDQGAAAITSEAAVEAKDSMVNNVRAYAATQNWPKETTDAELSKRLTGFHAQRIQQLARTDPDSATAYFKANEKEIAGSQRAEIGAFADKATAASTGAREAAVVWDTMGPKSDSDVSRIDQMEASLRKSLKDKPLALEVALKTVAQMDSARDKGIKAAEDGGKARVNEMLMAGMPLSRVMRTPEFAALKDPRGFVLHEENIAAARSARAAAEESRAYTREQRVEHNLNTKGIDTAWTLSDPNRLMALSRDQVINLRPTIGTENTQHLLNKYDAYTKDAVKLSEAKVDNNQFNEFAARAGFKPYDTKAAEEDKEKLNMVRDRVERVISNEQVRLKKTLSREEKDVIMQRALDDTVMQSRTFWFDKQVPAVNLLPDETKGAYVVVPGSGGRGSQDREVQLSSIPANDRAQIVQALQKKNLPVTQREIARLWLKRKDAAAAQ